MSNTVTSTTPFIRKFSRLLVLAAWVQCQNTSFQIFGPEGVLILECVGPLSPHICVTRTRTQFWGCKYTKTIALRSGWISAVSGQGSAGISATHRQAQWTLNIIQLETRWNVMAHAQKPDFVFRAKRTSRFKSAGRGVSTVEYWRPRCAPSAVVMLDTPCSEVVWRVLANHCIRQFPLHVPYRASPCTITFQLESNRCEGLIESWPYEHYSWHLVSRILTFWCRNY